jgi:hypothetical protein
MAREDRLTTLGLLWTAWEQQVQTLLAEQWQRPTRLGDWTVRMLYAHAAEWPFGFSHLVGQNARFQPGAAHAAVPSVSWPPIVTLTVSDRHG